MLGASGKLVGAVNGEQDFSTFDHIWAVKGWIQDSKKDQDAANDAKLQGIVSNQGAFDKRLLLFAKHTGAGMIIRGNRVTSTVLAATVYCYFYALITTLAPLTTKTNMMVVVGRSLLTESLLT